MVNYKRLDLWDFSLHPLNFTLNPATDPFIIYHLQFTFQLLPTLHHPSSFSFHPLDFSLRSRPIDFLPRLYGAVPVDHALRVGLTDGEGSDDGRAIPNTHQE